MISFVHLSASKLPCGSDELYSRFRKTAEPYGCEPDIVLVSAKRDAPADVDLRESAYMFVDLSQHWTWPNALRAGLSRATGSLVMFTDKLEDATPQIYEKLCCAAKYPIRSAGGTFIEEPHTLEPSRPSDLGVRRYSGPLRFPFTLRRAAIEEAGALPPVTGSSLEAQLFAYTLMLRGAGWWIGGAVR